ncbi:T9SS type A sorting domain-containing protein [Saccharicrinis aurantiacus]|uniref:T9SS type A sorting domain-containing protein n=1 Tax=Saccharicrinis aurantiacus TaxID=1849719 RepID=UPI002492E228|nr:T9SS type A sorting domain-containing protein [Saccharicrinis aurantiacus]
MKRKFTFFTKTIGIIVCSTLLSLTSKAQYSTIYETDFSTLTNGQNILLEKEADEIIWTGSNQIWNNFVKREAGLQTHSNWRGAHLSGKPIGTWAVGKSVKVTTEVIITDSGIFDEVINVGGSVTRDLMFGITEREDHQNPGLDAEGNPKERGDNPSYGSAVSIGFELRDLSDTEGELQIRLVNLTSQLFVISEIANNDVIRFEYTATKMAEANTFNVILDIFRNESKVSTLLGTFEQAAVYNAAAEMTVFNAYCKIPYNAGGVSNGTDENHGLLWASMKLEIGDNPTSFLPETKDEVKVYCSNGVLFINNVSNEVSAYKIYDIQGAIVKEGTLASNKIQIPLTLNKGIYLVRVGNTTTKIIL